MFEASLRSGKYSPRVLSRDPWVVVYDDFLSAQEADQDSSSECPSTQPRRKGLIRRLLDRLRRKK